MRSVPAGLCGEGGAPLLERAEDGVGEGLGAVERRSIDDTSADASGSVGSCSDGAANTRGVQQGVESVHGNGELDRE